MAGFHIRDKVFDTATPVGFLLPFLVAALIGWAIYAHSKPVAAPLNQETAPSGKVTVTTPALPPTAEEVDAADAAILAYCTSDLRADTGCSLVADSNQTAPGFVLSGLHMTGQFAVDGAGTDGLALAKGSGSSWHVVWVGQQCIPQEIATQNRVPAALTICP